MNASSSERRIALTGPSAREWLRRRGWSLSEETGPQQLYADEIRRRDFVIRRQWTSTISGRWTALDPDITQVTLVIEGDARVEIGGKESRLHGGYAIWRDRGAKVSLESPTPLALMQIESAGVPRDFISAERGDGAVFEALPALREMLAGQISATLNSEIEPSMNEFAYLQGSIEYATMALLLGVEKKARGRDLYHRAADILITRASDPELTLDEVAEELRISKSHVQRAFRNAGTTPLTFLERRRVTIARTLLEDGTSPTSEEVDSVARRAGFSSTRMMKDAFRREAARPRKD